MDINLDQITLVHIVLNESEARSALAEPAHLLAAIRASLAAAHGGNGHRRNRKVAPAPKVARGRKPRTLSGGAAKTWPISRKPCPKCGRTYKTSKRLATHIAKQHPDIATAATA